ncbi:TetR/AcrR family transcriptional regulator [Streptomyces lonegramiae]|uniref:TetR/AcrR family transcriptional regulator n=1 Tax=Streptomyces lonegramiae TaxID=3075524 RepID=A0ABU2X905_9ACTN|nr:TetR/AcrR family transcriptional regulator [Streptomyces sp. DSM 41529]MDT0542404.1 TetR/AcrR family transcriptional regulator [Streptomyces sp. DSM 41529]
MTNGTSGKAETAMAEGTRGDGGGRGGGYGGRGPGGTRRGARGGERRAEIVRCALEVIAERGYRGATLGAVAERVGLTQQGLLHYFPTKESLLVAVLEERDQWDTGSARKGESGAWPLDLLASLVEYNAMRPGIVQTFSALLGESVTEDHPAREYFTRRYEHVRADMAATLRGEFGDRLPGGLTPEEAAPLLVAVMDGLQYQWLHDPEALDMPAAFRSFLTLLGQPAPPRG